MINTYYITIWAKHWVKDLQKPLSQVGSQRERQRMKIKLRLIISQFFTERTVVWFYSAFKHYFNNLLVQRDNLRKIIFDTGITTVPQRRSNFAVGTLSRYSLQFISIGICDLIWENRACVQNFEKFVHVCKFVWISTVKSKIMSSYRYTDSLVTYIRKICIARCYSDFLHSAHLYRILQALMNIWRKFAISLTNKHFCCETSRLDEPVSVDTSWAIDTFSLHEMNIMTSQGSGQFRQLTQKIDKWCNSENRPAFHNVVAATNIEWNPLGSHTWHVCV